MKATVNGTLKEFELGDVDVEYDRHGDGYPDYIQITHAWLYAPNGSDLPPMDIAPYLAEHERESLRQQAENQLQ